jgi:hypothetical protein
LGSLFLGVVCGIFKIWNEAFNHNVGKNEKWVVFMKKIRKAPAVLTHNECDPGN